jgi:hypothetical protein
MAVRYASKNASSSRSCWRRSCGVVKSGVVRALSTSSEKECRKAIVAFVFGRIACSRRSSGQGSP